MTQTATEPRWRRLPGERPGQILRAALEVFSEQGLADARLDDIAKRAGLSKGTIYLYFPNKEELFREVVRTSVIAFIERAEENVRAEDDAMQAFDKWMVGYWTLLRSPVFPAMHRLMTAELRNFPDLAAFYATEVIERAQRLVCGMLERCMDAGIFRRMDPLVAARMLSALFITHANWYHQRQCFSSAMATADDDTFRVQIRDFFMHAMRITPPAAPRNAST